MLTNLSGNHQVKRYGMKKILMHMPKVHHYSEQILKMDR